LEQVLIKALAKKPEDRYQRMGELVVALEGLTGSQMAGAGKKLEVLNNQEEERKEAETTREVQQRLTYHHQRSTKWGGWAVLGALVVLVALGVALGIGLLNMGQKGIGPLANLANRTSTPSMEATSAAIGSTRTRPVDGMEMVYVPRGEFLMGSTSSDKMAGSEEKPQHTVSLDAYWIDKTNVTNLMYAICVSAGACQVPSTSASKMRSSYYGNSLYDNYPVIYVSWTDANAYCAWAGARLPTEAEWEKAARGTDGKIYPWGSGSPSSRLLNYNSNIGDTTAVGSYPSGASPYGAFDMAGNIWEWVNDWYSATYYSQSPASNPQGPAMGQSRVLRGGALNDSGTGVRSALRYWGLPTNSAYNIGFRCARSSP
jgi:formylglycine-generating enzyme required for sulfatase activity